MAYTTVNKGTDHFNTLTWTGNGSSSRNITGVGFQPDLTWIKNRDETQWHFLFDSVRGASRAIHPNEPNAESSQIPCLSAFLSDGFTVGTDIASNGSGDNIVAWNWKAGGTAPAVTYTVKVVSDSGNKYRFDDFGTSAVTLDLQEGGVYTFDQSDSSNSNHPLRFSTTSNGTHGGGSEYTTGVVATGVPGQSGAKTVITVAASAPTLFYYCTQHSGMGGQANTNSLFGSSNFGGSIQSKASVNATSGFSIVEWTGDGSESSTVGHGLGAELNLLITKETTGADWWHHVQTGMSSASHNVFWNNNNVERVPHNDGHLKLLSNTSSFGFDSSTSNVNAVNHSGIENIAYCFKNVPGFSKFGSYKGNGNATYGPFIYTGFKPAFTMVKRIDVANDWNMQDIKRALNGEDRILQANNNNGENVGGGYKIDKLSNGFKCRESGTETNADGGTYIYMAFAEAPQVGTNNVPCTAR